MLSLAKFIKKEIELRENLVGTGFLDPPSAKQTNEEAFKDETRHRALASSFMAQKVPDQTADTRVTCLGKFNTPGVVAQLRTLAPLFTGSYTPFAFTGEIV